RKKQIKTIEPLENLSYDIDMANQESKTLPICKCDHEDEIYHQHEKRVNENKKLRYEVEEKKIELQEAEKYLEYLKS
ncbi:2634_t:CDS:2, partial [Entrophospora sp. SA101]